MQKTSHTIQYPRFLKLFELWGDHRRVEDRREETCMEKEKTELGGHSLYLCYTCARVRGNSFDTCKKGGPSFLFSNLFQNQVFVLEQEKTIPEQTTLFRKKSFQKNKLQYADRNGMQH